MRLRHGWIRAGVLLMASAILRVPARETCPGRKKQESGATTVVPSRSKGIPPLDQITRDNVGSVQVLWRRPAMDAELTAAFPDLEPEGYQRSTPVLIDGVLYSAERLGPG